MQKLPDLVLHGGFLGSQSVGVEGFGVGTDVGKLERSHSANFQQIPKNLVRQGGSIGSHDSRFVGASVGYVVGGAMFASHFARSMHTNHNAFLRQGGLSGSQLCKFLG